MSQRQDRQLTALLIIIVFLIVFALGSSTTARAQDAFDNTLTDEDVEDELIPPLPEPGDIADDEELIEEEPPFEGEEEIEGGEAGEGETRWNVKLTAAVRANYVFNDSPDSFVVKYTWEIDGTANAATAVIRGNADISVDVEGFLSKWPTGECALEVTVPKVPFELTFSKTDDERGRVALNFKRAITENWQSRCSFTDAPGARFDTIGAPEKWLARAIEKARPPLRSLVADITDEETTTTFIINKDIIDDAPLGTMEIEGTGVLTIAPAGIE